MFTSVEKCTTYVAEHAWVHIRVGHCLTVLHAFLSDNVFQLITQATVTNFRFAANKKPFP
jgi:hypothetical protein